MKYWKRLADAIDSAGINILQFDIHHRNSLEQRNRLFPFYVASYIKEGTCRVHMGENDYYAGPGDVVLIPSGVLHDHVKDTVEPTIFMWWHFTFKIANKVDILRMFDVPVCFKVSDPDRFERIFSDYVRCALDPSSVSDIILKEAKALELIAMLLESAVSVNNMKLKSGYSDTFTEILGDIVKNPEKDNFLKQLGEKYHLHPTYISNHFKELYDISPIQLQKELRMEKARKLLKSDSLPISQIAEMVGYDDIDDFTRFFKKRQGISPSKYRSSFLNAGQNGTIGELVGLSDETDKI